MRHLLGLIVGLATLWLLLSGHYTSPILSFGAASCAAVAWLCWRLRIVDYETVPLHLLLRFPAYFAWLVIEIAKSSLSVARCIVMPSMRISPTVIRVTAHQKTDFGQMTYGNSITLTPGTVTVSLENGQMEVHALTRDNADDIETGGMDRRICALEGER